MAALTFQDHIPFGVDSSFETYIDADLILDTGSPRPATPARDMIRQVSKHSSRVASLSALPSRLSIDIDRHGHPSPSPGINVNVTDFLRFHGGADGSPLTTPTTSNSSNLQTLSFDFGDVSEGSTGAPGSTTATSLSPHDNLSMANFERTFVSCAAQEGSAPVAVASQSMPMSSFQGTGGHALADFAFGDSALAAGSAMVCKPMLPTQGQSGLFARAVDDMGPEPGHQHTVQHNGHHHRSLSLRDVAPYMQQGAMSQVAPQAMARAPPSLTSAQQRPIDANTSPQKDHAPIPSLEDRGSPSSSTVSSSIFDYESPQQGKRRRLSSSAKTDATSVKSRKGSNASRASTKSSASADPPTSAVIKKPAKSCTGTKKGRKQTQSNGAETKPTVATGISAASLIENMPQVVSVGPTANFSFNDPAMQTLATQSLGMAAPLNVECGLIPGQTHFSSDDIHPSTDDTEWLHGESDEPPKRGGNKRPPPSASQITESGLPFPVIDTSAKHSSLFVPPDTSGLTKREARLVKNRAAAFLSRQRKREQFEELEVKCKSLCHLVWKLWQVGVAGDDPASPQTHFHSLVAQDESADVREILETVLALGGGSIAPTEDGQLQGAVAAGIQSAHGKLLSDGKPISLLAVPSCAAKAAHKASRELAKVRAELAESRAREAQLQSRVEELAPRHIATQSTFDVAARHSAEVLSISWPQTECSHTGKARPDEPVAEDTETNTKTAKSRVTSERASRKKPASRSSAVATDNAGGVVVTGVKVEM